MKLFGRRNALTLMRDILAPLALTACVAVAQEANSPQDARQPLDNAWWTGLLLAPSANTLPSGHVLIEPYLYDIISQGFYVAKPDPVVSCVSYAFRRQTWGLDTFSVRRAPGRRKFILPRL
ncbi:MAG TPA: hypothetical protein VJP02_25325 [Candidatus Sulfotelmatobacter sp.]|nr:hypothetical protein [Candidatus Sulfotelmatobacter sp.]